MNTLKTISNIVLATVALVPLAPVVALMWTAKGIYSLKQMKIAKSTTPVAPTPWYLDTMVHFPTGI